MLDFQLYLISAIFLVKSYSVLEFQLEYIWCCIFSSVLSMHDFQLNLISAGFSVKCYQISTGFFVKPYQC